VKMVATKRFPMLALIADDLAKDAIHPLAPP
jgi:hypothetical protein